MSSPRRVAILMSRLPRLVDPQADWLLGLRAAIRRIQRSSMELILVDGTAGSHFVRRAAERLSVSLVAIPATGQSSDVQADADPIPLPDRMLAGSADLAIVLGVRPRGNIHRLLVELLERGEDVELVDVPGLQPITLRDELQSLGARIWTPGAQDLIPFDSTENEALPMPSFACEVCEIVSFPKSKDWQFLSHTTRACRGPWPDQSSTEYIDSLLDASADADHSSLATLKRIVRQRRILASPQANRGGHRVVCLTAVPLGDLPGLRTFRTHRARWDFEPYGICIRKDWLEAKGARPVMYGPENLWRQSSKSERPWFQLVESDVQESHDGPMSRADWTLEREWRHWGDLDLSDLLPDGGLVFVPDYEAAKAISKVSPWPVTLWPGAQ